MASVKEKIQKLLSLATSPNENEAKAALLKAKELMAKHKLSESDFESEDQKLKKYLCEDIRWTTDSGEIWMTSLCKIICDNYCCSSSWSFVKGHRTYTLVIVGVGDDADICKDVVGYAVGFVRSAIKGLQKKYRRQDPKAISNSYAQGFVTGLEMAFEEQKEDHPEWGLVVVKTEEVNEYEKGLGNKNVKTKKSDFDPLAYLRGQADGKNFNPHKVIDGTC